MTITVDANANAVGIFNTNAEDITITIKNTTETVTLDGPDAYQLDTLTRYYTDTGATYPNMIADYDVQAAEHKVIIDFTAAVGVTVQCGEVVPGYKYSFRTPAPGLRQEYIDYSIRHKLNFPGAHYRLQKDMANMFTGSAIMERDTDFWYFMRDFVEQNGPFPVPWHLTDDTDHEWTVFAGFQPDAYPGGSHSFPSHGAIDFSIIEEF